MESTSLKCIFGNCFDLIFAECLIDWSKNILIFELEYKLVGKDITYRMLLYLFVYFLHKITTNKHAILFDREIVNNRAI